MLGFRKPSFRNDTCGLTQLVTCPQMWVHRGWGEGLALRQGPSIVDISTLALFMNSSILRDKPLCILLPWQL